MHQVYHSTIVRSAHIVFMCFVWISEQTDFCHIHHKLTGFYNREEKCLQRGTDWVFKSSSLRFVCKGVMRASSECSILIHVNFSL